MELVELHAGRPIPHDGYMVCTPTVHLRVPRGVAVSSCRWILEDFDKFIEPCEVLVVVVCESVIMLQTWKQVMNKPQAKEYSRQSGYNTIYNCVEDKLEYVDLAWKGRNERHEPNQRP